MHIIRDDEYLKNLETILEYIAKDSFNKMVDFLAKLDHKIEQIENFPYKYRQSIYHNNKETRDLIFKGYTIPYLIDNDKQHIIILDIFKWINKPQ